MELQANEASISSRCNMGLQSRRKEKLDDIQTTKLFSHQCIYKTHSPSVRCPLDLLNNSLRFPPKHNDQIRCDTGPILRLHHRLLKQLPPLRLAPQLRRLLSR